MSTSLPDSLVILEGPSLLGVEQFAHEADLIEIAAPYTS